MDTHRIEWRPSAYRELRRLDRQVISRILRSVELLASDPFPPGARKLRGGRNTYRIRVRDYRVVYEVIGSQHDIRIVRVRHRKDVYRP